MGKWHCQKAGKASGAARLAKLIAQEVCLCMVEMLYRIEDCAEEQQVEEIDCIIEEEDIIDVECDDCTVAHRYSTHASYTS